MKTQLEFYIEEIEKRLERLHEMSVSSFIKAMKAFEDLDRESAAEVKEFTDDIEELQHKIEGDVLETIARRQPVAKDLRKLATYLQVSYHLYRVGRFAHKIAHVTRLSEGIEHFKKLESLPYLADLARKTLDISMKAMLKEDLSEVKKLEEMEAESDRETAEMFEEIAEYLRKRNDITTMALFYILIGRYCERAADHAFEIAESAVYIVTGKRTKLGIAYKKGDDFGPH